jgi:hypothetical protein
VTVPCTLATSSASILMMKCGRATVWSLMIAAIIPFVGCTTYCTDLDTPAIGSIKRIQAAEEQFLKRHGRYGELHELLPSSGGPLPGELVSGQSRGHKFILRANGPLYSVQTVPVEWGRTGSRSFYSDQTNVIRASDGTNFASVMSRELK